MIVFVVPSLITINDDCIAEARYSIVFPNAWETAESGEVYWGDGNPYHGLKVFRMPAEVYDYGSNGTYVCMNLPEGYCASVTVNGEPTGIDCYAYETFEMLFPFYI